MTRLLALVIPALALACSSNDADPADAGEVDAGVDAGTADAGEIDAGPADERGFHVRVPQERSVPCQNCTVETEVMRDIDYVCEFTHGEAGGVIYVQSNAKSTTQMGPGPVYETVAAWISHAGVATPITASYEAGGNHRNDSLDFTAGGVDYRLYHSSFGFGWRKCHPMDCLQVYASDHTLAVDGCTSARTLPAVCVPVGDDGSVPPLTDTFEKCLGDPNP